MGSMDIFTGMFICEIAGGGLEGISIAANSGAGADILQEVKIKEVIAIRIVERATLLKIID